MCVSRGDPGCTRYVVTRAVPACVCVCACVCPPAVVRAGDVMEPECPFAVGVLVMNNLGRVYSGSDFVVHAKLRRGLDQVSATAWHHLARPNTRADGGYGFMDGDAGCCVGRNHHRARCARHGSVRRPSYHRTR